MKVTEAVYAATVRMLWGWARMLDQMPLAEVLQAADHADAIGSFIDPTLYREKHDAMREDRRLLRAFLTVKSEFAAMKGASGQVAAGDPVEHEEYRQ